MMDGLKLALRRGQRGTFDYTGPRRYNPRSRRCVANRFASAFDAAESDRSTARPFRDHARVRPVDPLGGALYPRVSRQDLRHRVRRRSGRRRYVSRHHSRPQPLAQPRRAPVVVHGSRPQIEAILAQQDIESRYASGLRITDAETMDCVLEANGQVRSRIEALLSLGIANSPMAGARIRVSTGNFITAKPLGVRDGTDMQLTGEVRRVDTDAMRRGWRMATSC
jgi:hypothetical protein